MPVRFMPLSSDEDKEEADKDRTDDDFQHKKENAAAAIDGVSPRRFEKPTRAGG
jgi:hypothetical protein